MGFENPSPFGEDKASEDEKKSIRERIVFPHVEPILALLKKEFGESEKEVDPEIVKDILYEFIEQRIDSAGVYRSEKHDVSFPFGVTDTADLAKRLYRCYARRRIGELEPNLEKKKKEFIFPSLQLIQSGNQFSFMEEPMHQAIKDLPRALAILKEGKEPNASKIYTLGSPTNELGEMSEEFLAKLKDGKAFDWFGSLYAEFVESTMSKEQKEGAEVLLYGQSMGASFATGTAKHLLEHGSVTQSREAAAEKSAHFLQVRLDMPVGSSELSAERKSWQIPVGFALNVAYTAATDPYVRSVMMSDKKFLDSVQEIFMEKGISPNVSEEQVMLKKAGITEAISNLRKGTPIPENLTVTKVVGVYDPLMYSGEFHREAKKHKKEHRGSLGESMVSKSPNRKTFGINMGHTMPHFRKNELVRLRRAAESLKELETPSKNSSG